MSTRPPLSFRYGELLTRGAITLPGDEVLELLVQAAAGTPRGAMTFQQPALDLWRLMVDADRPRTTRALQYVSDEIPAAVLAVVMFAREHQIELEDNHERRQSR